MEMRTVKRRLSRKDGKACSGMIYLRAGRRNEERAIHLLSDIIR